MNCSDGRITTEIYIIIIIVSGYFDCTETKLYKIIAPINPRQVQGKIPEMACDGNIRGRVCNSVKLVES